MPPDDASVDGWTWFDSLRRGSAADAEEPWSTVAAIAARCFRGQDGVRLLVHLRQLTVERSVAPDICEAQLRHLEGQRHLVRYLETMIKIGAAGPPATRYSTSDEEEEDND